MIRRIFNAFLSLIAIAFNAQSTKRSPAPGSPGSPAGDLSFKPGSPKIKAETTPGAFGKQTTIVANCRKIWRNRHGKHIK